MDLAGTPALRLRGNGPARGALEAGNRRPRTFEARSLFTSNDTLQALLTALDDAREGYRTAIDKAEDAQVLALLRTADSLHAAAHADIHRILANRGERPDDDGSFMGMVHKTVITARAAVVGLDEGSLDAFASGEENTLERYDETIRDEVDPALRERLSEHRTALVAQIDNIKKISAQLS